LFAEFTLTDGKVKSVTVEAPSAPNITLERKQ